MKIALVTKRLSNSLGGAERVSVSLARSFVAAGNEVHIFAGSSDLTINGVLIHEINAVKWLSPWRLLSFQRKVSEALRREHFDIVYSLCQVYPVDIYRVGDGIHRHWMRLRHPNPVRRAIAYATSLVNPAMVWLEDRITGPGNCTFFITNSRLVRDQLMHYYRIPEEQIRVIYNGVDHEVFNPDVRAVRKEMRDRYDISEKELLLLFVSNNWERKGLATIIEAMAKNSSGALRLMIAGRGDERPYRRLAEKRGLSPSRLLFTGRTAEIEKFYALADVFILPTHYEPFSNVCLEAMACGIPVITTRGNGASELIREGENGFVLETWDDATGLSEMLGALRDEGLRNKMGAEASVTATEFTWEKHINETLQVFDKLGKSGKRIVDR